MKKPTKNRIVYSLFFLSLYALSFKPITKVKETDDYIEIIKTIGITPVIHRTRLYRSLKDDFDMLQIYTIFLPEEAYFDGVEKTDHDGIVDIIINYDDLSITTLDPTQEEIDKASRTLAKIIQEYLTPSQQKPLTTSSHHHPQP